MFIWGGFEAFEDQITQLGDGALYDPELDSWSPLPAQGAPTPRESAAAFWTGSAVLVWGGQAPVGGEGQPEPGDEGGARSDGALYCPESRSWLPISEQGAPVRTGAAIVWCGRELIVWGGIGDSDERLNTGAVYDVDSDSWRPTSTQEAPAGRINPVAVWTGDSLFVFGGSVAPGEPAARDGGLYDPVADAWTPVTAAGLSENASTDFAALWTGSEVLVWFRTVRDAEGNSFDLLASFDPVVNEWRERPMEPERLVGDVPIWTGDEAIAWLAPLDRLGRDGRIPGGVFDPATDRWADFERPGAPLLAGDFSAVWTGSEMIVWGGFRDTLDPTNLGGRFRPRGHR